MKMDPIVPLTYITDKDPSDLVAHVPSDWYTTEEQQNIRTEALGWMQAQGWAISDTTQLTSGEYVYKMTRRRIDPEKVLQTLIKDYTDAYNEGRKLNDQRYDDIVTIYAVMVGKTQEEIISAQTSDSDYYGLISSLVSSIETDQAAYAADVLTTLDNYGNSVRAQINARFDAQLSRSKQNLISRGMYNTTVLDSLTAGIERERSQTLTDLEDKIAQQRVSIKTRVHADKAEMRDRVMAAHGRLRDTLMNAWDRELTMRNALIQAMVNFMERRTDSYPGLDSVGKLAANLGAGNPTAFEPAKKE